VPTVYSNIPTVYNRPLVYTAGLPVVVKQDPAPEAPETTEETTAAPEEKKIVIPGYSLLPQVATPYIVPAPVAAFPKYYANSAGVTHIVNKREADASADAAYYYSPYAYSYGYGLPYAARPYAYGYGFRPYGLYY